MEKLGKQLIFKFYSAKEFLAEFYRLKKESNHRWSYSVWGRDLNIKDPSLLRKACQGSRSFSPALEKKLVTYFKFNINEAKHFHGIIAYTEFQKAYPKIAPYLISSFEKIVTANKCNKFTPDQFLSMKSMWDFCLLTLSEDHPLDDENIETIARSFGVILDPNELKKSAKRMLEAGILEEKDGALVRSFKQAEFSRSLVTKENIEELHAANLDIAKLFAIKSIEDKSITNSSHSNTMLMNSNNFRALIIELGASVDKILDKFEDKNGDVLIQHLSQSFTIGNIKNLKKAKVKT